jgi:hypothetical protein
VLLHHRDVQNLLRVCLRTHPSTSLTLTQEDEEGMIRVLVESEIAKRVEVDENGCKLLTILARLISQIFTFCSWATGTGKSRNNQIFKADLVWSSGWRCGRYRGTWSGEYRRSRSYSEMNRDRL